MALTKQQQFKENDRQKEMKDRLERQQQRRTETNRKVDCKNNVDIDHCIDVLGVCWIGDDSWAVRQRNQQRTD